MNCSPARPKEECLGKACQQTKQGALHSEDSIRPSPGPLRASNCAFSSHPALWVRKQSCVCVFLPQERLGQKRKRPGGFLPRFWRSGTMRGCAACGIFPHCWEVRRDQQRHTSHTPQIPELATTKDIHRPQPWDNSFCQSTAVLMTVPLLLHLHTKERVTPGQALEKTTQTSSHSGAASLAGSQH